MMMSMFCFARYVWTYNECQHVAHVAKTDDNVLMNVTQLMDVLDSRQDSQKQFIACSVPSRNIAIGKVHSNLLNSRDNNNNLESLVKN